jgi:hypothetical protein
MLDNETMILLARFSHGVRRLGGQVDTKRLAKDADYRKEIFRLVENLDDIDLLALSFTIKNHFNTRYTAPISRLMVSPTTRT